MEGGQWKGCVLIHSMSESAVTYEHLKSLFSFQILME